MSSDINTDMNNVINNLKNNRKFPLSCESIGWLHMAGKANIEFLKDKIGSDNYKYKNFLDDTQLKSDDGFKKWAKNFVNAVNGYKSLLTDPPTVNNDLALYNFVNVFFQRHADSNDNFPLLALLQAAHAMASGIEKQSLHTDLYETLNESIWLTSSFGYGVKNLLDEPSGEHYESFKQYIPKFISDFNGLNENDIDGLYGWRESIVGESGCLRKYFNSTLAETRIPNNDVTLFDQSYVTAALFKSAVAQALLEDLRSRKGLKQNTKWKILTIGIGSEHYEKRSVKIGDFLAAKEEINKFFVEVKKLVEIDLALGSELYRDNSVIVFSFPGLEATDNISLLNSYLNTEIDSFAQYLNLETPPYVKISEENSRSLVKMTNEIGNAKEIISSPLFRNWNVNNNSSDGRNVCPVCKVRKSSGFNKQNVCGVCEERRKKRVELWKKDYSKTIWIDEVADKNGRVALLSLSFDLDSWLDGSNFDSMRSVSLERIKMFFKGKNVDNFKSNCKSICKNAQEDLDSSGSNNFINKFNSSYRPQQKKEFFKQICDDRREKDRISWDSEDNSLNAHWLMHQLMRKLSSPGRINRVQTSALKFFEELKVYFEKKELNNPRFYRLKITPELSVDLQENQTTYTILTEYGNIPVIYFDGSFLSIGNLEVLSKDLRDKISKSLCDCIPLEKVLSKDLTDKDYDLISNEGESKKIKIKSVELEEAPYSPYIQLEHSSSLFRVLLPLEDIERIVDTVIKKWHKEFNKVWDKMPLRVNIVAFPRMTPFQAVTAAIRKMEESTLGNKVYIVESNMQIDDFKKKIQDYFEKLIVEGLDRKIIPLYLFNPLNLMTQTVLEISNLFLEALKELSLLKIKEDGSSKCEEISINIKLPDGREDMYYPYARLADRKAIDSSLDLREDFSHPDPVDSSKQIVYRHMKDLSTSDKIVVSSPHVQALFLDSSCKRWDDIPLFNFTEWEKMQRLWYFISDVLKRNSKGKSALKSIWSELSLKKDSWKDAEGKISHEALKSWRGLLKVFFINKLNFSEEEFRKIEQAEINGLLDWCINWNLSVLKKSISPGGENVSNK